MSRPGMYVASVIALGLIAVGVWQFMPAGEDAAIGTATDTAAASEGRDPAPFQPPAAGAMSVTATAAHRGELTKRITANGVAEAQKLLNISAEVAGKIRHMAVVEGQWVEAGELLLELDDTELIMERDRAAESFNFNLMNFANNQIVVAGAESSSSVSAQRESSENALEFLRKYINESALATIMRQPNVEERLKELTPEDLFAATAGLTAQRVALERAELDLVRARVVAPFSGQLAGIAASSGPNSKSWPVVGQQVASGTDLMMLVDPDPIHVRVEVIESEISFVRRGRRADVSFPAFPGEVFSGTIETIDPVVNAARKTLSVSVQLANADHRLKPGMFAQVVLDTEIYEDRLLVPASAVLLRDERQLIFVVRNGRAQWVYVLTGEENGRWIEILGDNVKEGDIVVTSGHFTLAHDVPVNIIEPADPGDPEGGTP